MEAKNREPKLPALSLAYAEVRPSGPRAEETDGSDVLSAMASANGLRRVPQLGNAQQRLSMKLNLQSMNTPWSGSDAHVVAQTGRRRFIVRCRIPRKPHWSLSHSSWKFLWLSLSMSGLEEKHSPRADDPAGRNKLVAHPLPPVRGLLQPQAEVHDAESIIGVAKRSGHRHSAGADRDGRDRDGYGPCRVRDHVRDLALPRLRSTPCSTRRLPRARRTVRAA